MADQNFLAPGPTQAEFNTLSSTVTTLNNQLANIFTIVDMSGTTTSNGNIDISNQVPSNKKPIFAYDNASTAVTLVYSIMYYSSGWFVHVREGNSASNVYGNKAVTFKVICI